IDVCQDRLDVACRPTGLTFQVGNDPAGQAALVQRLRPLAPALVALEATGGLHAAAAAALAAAGLPVVVLNPAQVPAFAKAAGRLAKTDALDADVLAHYAEALKPTPRPLPDAAAREFEALLSRHRQLLQMRVAEQNRLGRATAVAV